jgi:hypothetical protein
VEKQESSFITMISCWIKSFDMQRKFFFFSTKTFTTGLCLLSAAEWDEKFQNMQKKKSLSFPFKTQLQDCKVKLYIFLKSKVILRFPWRGGNFSIFPLYSLLWRRHLRICWKQNDIFFKLLSFSFLFKTLHFFIIIIKVLNF